LAPLGANCFGAEVQGHFLRVVDVGASVELGAMDLGAELSANFYAAELGANCYGAELWKLTNLNFYMT
jgi:hypothetical protein